MNIKYNVEKVSTTSQITYLIYDVSDSQFQCFGANYIGGVTISPLLDIYCIEAKNSRGECICRTFSAPDKITSMIELVKRAYERELRTKIHQEEEWEKNKEDAIRLGVDQELFKSSASIRGYIKFILEYESELVEELETLKTIRSYMKESHFSKAPKEIKALIESEMESTRRNIQLFLEGIDDYERRLQYSINNKKGDA